MKDRKHRVNKAEAKPIEAFADFTSDEMMGDVIGTKVLYNWLYQQEEEDYYLNAKASGPLPDFSEQEALFVEY